VLLLLTSVAHARAMMVMRPMAWSADTHFELTNAKGAPVTDKAFRGRFLLLEIDPAGCGASCAALSSKVRDAISDLGETGRRVEVEHVTQNNQGADGTLRGSPEAVRRLLRGHGVQTADGEGVLVLDDDYGVFVERLDATAPAAFLAERLRKLITARVTYLGIDEVLWNYAPNPMDMAMGAPLDDHQKSFVYNGPEQIGSTYLKAVYRGYTDGSFSALRPRPPEWRHLGLLGPVIHAEVGDTLRVVVRNSGHQPYSLHVHGLLYAPSSEGGMTAGHMEPSGVIPPGGVYTYVYDVPERAGPGPSDPSSVVWPYHSHVDEGVDENTGLIGAIVVTRKGQAKPDGSPKDVDREFVTLFKIFDENRSALLQDNILRFTEPGRAPAGDLIDEDDKANDAETQAWIESNLKHAINGFIFGNLPGLDMIQGERVRWYMIGLGSESDLHTPHWHGNTVVTGGRRVDVVDLLPATSLVADMIPDNPGEWMFHCHVVDHLNAGMTALYRVTPQSKAPVSSGVK
jgi:hypothetical protein